MKKFLFGLSALPFLVGAALAAEPLNNAQMDRVTAGACSPGFTCSIGNGMSTITACPGCTGGQVFTIAVGQPLFPTVVEFLIQNNYKPM